MSEEIVERKIVGNLEYTVASNENAYGTKTRVRLLRCPSCGMEFSHNSGSVRRRHFSEVCGWDEIVGD